jgi:hypothetical protein
VTPQHGLAGLGVPLLVVATAVSAPAAHADNKRLNDGAQNVYTIQHQLHHHLDHHHRRH